MKSFGLLHIQCQGSRWLYLLKIQLRLSLLTKEDLGQWIGGGGAVRGCKHTLRGSSPKRTLEFCSSEITLAQYKRLNTNGNFLHPPPFLLCKVFDLTFSVGGNLGYFYLPDWWLATWNFGLILDFWDVKSPKRVNSSSPGRVGPAILGLGDPLPGSRTW